jgi:hypothetical protein
VDSVVKARRSGDKNKESNVVAETMKLIANSSYGYQILDRSKHTNTKYVTDQQVDKMINSKRFRKYNALNDSIHEITLAKQKIVHREPIVVGFFILQYAKLRMLELYYNFFVKYCDPNLYEEIEMDTDSLYLALGCTNLDDLVRDEMKEEWNSIRSKDCRDNFEADSEFNFFPRSCCSRHNAFDQRTPGLFKEEFRGTCMIALCSKTYCCFNGDKHVHKFSSKGLNKRPIENDPDESPLAKYRRVMSTHRNITSTNMGFRVNNNRMQTYYQRKQGLAYFYVKRIVLEDGIHTRPLNL